VPAKGHKEMSSIFWLTNRTLVYEPNGGEGGMGEFAGSQPMSTAVQINFGDLTLF
jgi:hypothetical protein